MSHIDQSNWTFSIGESPILPFGQGTDMQTKPLAFSTSVELLRYLADGDNAHLSSIQNQIKERIESDSIARDWAGNRTLLKDLVHFPKYRKNSFDNYHDAARARVQEQATPKQLTLANGLDAEIKASRIAVPPSQIVFHGRADRALTDMPTYPSFISTSLDPVVAHLSALRRAGLNQKNGRPTVYVLTLDCTLPALWGQIGRSHENELLLQAMLKCEFKTEYVGKNFDVIEATIAL